MLRRPLGDRCRSLPTLPPRRVGALLGAVLLTVAASACCAAADDGAGVRSASGAASGPAAASTGSSGAAALIPVGIKTGAARPPAEVPLQGAECSVIGNSVATPVATVQVEIGVYTMHAIPGQVQAGTVQVVAHNSGSRPHSVAIARFDGDAADLPVDEHGAVDVEQLPEGALVGEIREFGVHGTCPAAFNLEPGNYVVFCYIVEDMTGAQPWAHYTRGTYAGLTVT